MSRPWPPAATRSSSGPNKPPIAIDNTFLGPLWAQPARAGRRHRRLFADQICRRPWSDLVAGGVRRHEGAHQQDPADAQHDRHDLRSQHRLDAAPQPGDAGAAHEPRGRECGQGLRVPARAPWGRACRLSRLPRGRIAPGGYLSAPLHRRGLDLLALSQGRREGGVRLSRQPQDRQARRVAWAAPRRWPATPPA